MVAAKGIERGARPLHLPGVLHVRGNSALTLRRVESA